MSRKEIIILIVVGIGCMLLSGVLSYIIASPKNTKEDVNILQVGKYNLHFGTYKGVEEEYDPDTQKINKKDVTLILSKDSIEQNGIKQKYTIKENSIYIEGTEMYQIISNDKMMLLAGAGMEFKYER